MYSANNRGPWVDGIKTVGKKGSMKEDSGRTMKHF